MTHHDDPRGRPSSLSFPPPVREKEMNKRCRSSCHRRFLLLICYQLGDDRVDDHGSGGGTVKCKEGAVAIEPGEHDDRGLVVAVEALLVGPVVVTVSCSPRLGNSR
jgi:hypothetical protein